MAQAAKKMPEKLEKELARIKAAHERFLGKIAALEKRRLEVMKKIHARVDKADIEKIRQSLK